MASTPWVFEQLGGERKELTLTGWQAPYGRPHQQPVVTDGIEIRKTEVYYPGDERGPTRHIFGRKYTPWELQGRFRDRADGKGFALAKVEEVKSFVSDQQRVRASWGGLLSAEGFIDKFEPSRESEGEVEWKLTFSVDVDLFDKAKKRKVQKPKSIGSSEQLARQDLKKALANVPHTPTTSIFDALDSILGLPGNVGGALVESFDSLVTLLTSTAGSFQKAANSISDVEKAAFGELNRLASVSNQMQGACGALRESYTNVPTDVLLLRERAGENARTWKAQSATEAALRDLAAEMADVRVAVQLATRGSASRTYVARQGDTFESISTQFYGAPSRASDIRAANNVPVGQNPIPGVDYLLPV